MRGHDKFRERLEAEPIIETKLRMALVELDRDPHTFSSRPCPTCDPIAELLGEPFGCARFRRTGRQSRLDGLFRAGGGSGMKPNDYGPELVARAARP